MENQVLSRLLNDACDIIVSLEHFADEDLGNSIEALFNEIKYYDELDSEMKTSSQDADDEAQDYSVFGDKKI